MNFFSRPNYIGVTELGAEQVAKLYTQRELVGSSAVVSLTETSPERWRIYPRRNQDGQSSCTYHARAKAAGILQEQATGEFIEYSAADYNKRSNSTSEGSSPLESFDYWHAGGIGLEALEPSNNLSAAQLASHKQSIFEKKAAEISKLGAFYSLPYGDFDSIVSTLHATKKPIPVGVWGTYREWNQDVPVAIPSQTYGSAEVKHEVCVTPNYGIYKGQEGFTIEDSWGSAGINGTGVRWITRDFFTRRNFIQGIVPTTFKSYDDININPAKPRIDLARDLDLGMTGDDVRALQEVYKYEGFFPANHSGSDYFGNITQSATRQYQAKYGIASSGTPSTTGYGRVGPSTRRHINAKYK